MRQTDLLIIGGGVLGTFHAYHALNRGMSVRLLEGGDEPRGSSVQNFGQVVPSGMDRHWQQYGRRSLDIYRTIQAQFDISVRQNGSIYLASDQSEWQLLQELAEINRAEDYPSELFTAGQCLEKYPGLRRDYCVGGLFFPQEVTVEPRYAIHRIRQYLIEQKELDYRSRSVVISVEETESGCLVVCSDGSRYQAARVLICGGYEFRLLFPEIYSKSDLEIVKLQMLLLASQPTLRIPGSVLTGWSIRRYESFRACPSYAEVKAGEDSESLQRKWGVHLLFKQATDGSIIFGDSHEYADAAEADTLGIEIREDINNFMIQWGKKIFDLEDWSVASTWAGRYAQCKTGDIFRHQVSGRVHILTGIGGKGMTGSAGFAEANIESYI